jgi:hypothetical protein
VAGGVVDSSRSDRLSGRDLCLGRGFVSHSLVRPQGSALAITSNASPVATTDQDLEDFGRTIDRKVKGTRRIPNFRREGPVATRRPVIGAMLASEDGRLLIMRADLSERPYDE